MTLETWIKECYDTSEPTFKELVNYLAPYRNIIEAEIETKELDKLYKDIEIQKNKWVMAIHLFSNERKKVWSCIPDETKEEIEIIVHGTL